MNTKNQFHLPVLVIISVLMIICSIILIAVSLKSRECLRTKVVNNTEYIGHETEQKPLNLQKGYEICPEYIGILGTPIMCKRNKR